MPQHVEHININNSNILMPFYIAYARKIIIMYTFTKQLLIWFTFPLILYLISISIRKSKLSSGVLRVYDSLNMPSEHVRCQNFISTSNLCTK